MAGDAVEVHKHATREAASREESPIGGPITA